MENKKGKSNLGNLPQSVQDFIKLVIKKMRYRKKVRSDVQAELAAHFEDELRDCQNAEEKEQKAKELIEQFGDAKLLGVLLRRAKKRCRPLWRTIVARTFQTIGVLILCFIFYTVWFLSGKPSITIDYVAKVNRLVCPVADDSLNAASFFDKAAISSPNTPDRRAKFWRKSYVDANETELRAMKDWVDKCSNGLDLIAEGTTKPYFWRKYKTGEGPNDDGSMLGVLMPNLNKFRNMARVFCWQAQINAQKGHYTKAFDSLTTCYKFGKLIKQGQKTLIEQLVGTAIEAIVTNNIRELIHHYDLESNQLKQLQEKFGAVVLDEDFMMRLMFEKLTMYDEIQRSFTEDRLGGGHLYIRRLQLLVGLCGPDTLDRGWAVPMHVLFTHPNKQETKDVADSVYDFWEQMASKTPGQLHIEGINLNEQTEQLVKGNIILEILIPATSKVHQITYRIKTDVNATLAVIAIIRYQKEKGTYPERLVQLVKRGYIKNIPSDSFSDKSLVYRKTDGGFTLYSVGLNFTDDGGQVYRDDKGRVRMWANEGDAVFWPTE